MAGARQGKCSYCGAWTTNPQPFRDSSVVCPDCLPKAREWLERHCGGERNAPASDDSTIPPVDQPAG